MKEKKEEIENKKIIDNEEDTIEDEIDSNDDEIDESVDDELDESDDEELEEDEDDELDKTRKIDFSNKNEVYQDFFDEKKKSKFVIFFIVVFILLLIGVICYFVYVNRDKIFNKIDDVVDNMDGLVDVENSDKDNSSGVVTPTSSDDVDEKVLNIYQKDSENVVVFTYKCKSTDCDIEVTKDGFILYDEEKVYHRDMTAYELEQINNTDKTPAKSELSFSGFEELNSIFDDAVLSEYMKKTYSDSEDFLKFCLESVKERNIFDISDNFYILSNNEIQTLDEYSKYSSDKIFVKDTFILSTSFIYDYKKSKVVFLDEEESIYFDNEKLGKVSNFNFFYVSDVGRTYDDVSRFYLIFDDNYVNGYFVYKKNNFYIKDDILYYIDDFKVIKANSKGEKLSFDNTNINALFIFDDKFIYFDDNETLKVKNLIDGELLYDSNVELKNIKGSDEFSYMVNSLNEGFILKYTDKLIITNEDFEEFRKKQNITDSQLLNIKKCINNYEECNMSYDLGHKIILDKDGKFVSNEYYIMIEE